MSTAAHASRSRLYVLIGAGIPFNAAQGAIFPYWILYLHDDLHFPTAIAGLTIGVQGIAALAGALVGGSLQDHLGARRTAQLGALLEALGYAFVITARTPAVVAAFFAIFGLSSMRYPARSAAALAALPEDLPATRFFSLDFMGANAGFGIGIVLGALIVSSGNPGAIRGLFVALAAASMVLAAAYGLLPNHRAPTQDRNRASYRAAAREASFWYLAGFGLLLSLASYSSFDAGIPAFIGIFLHASPRLIALAFLTNPILIVLGQGTVTRLVIRLRWRRAWMLAASTFATAWLILLAALWFRSHVALAAELVAFAACFSLAEMLTSPLRTQLVAALAPAHLRGRFFGVNHFARGVAGLIGPSLAGAMIGAGLGFPWLGLVALAGYGATGLIRHIFRMAPPELAQRT